MGTESWHLLWDQCSELWALSPASQMLQEGPSAQRWAASVLVASSGCLVGQGEAGDEPGKLRVWCREARGHVKKCKQVRYRVVIRFLTGSEKTIRNNWNETEQKKIMREGCQVLRNLLWDVMRGKWKGNRQSKRKLMILVIGLGLKGVFPLIFIITPLRSKGKSSPPFYRWSVQGQPDWTTLGL